MPGFAQHLSCVICKEPCNFDLQIEAFRKFLIVMADVLEETLVEKPPKYAANDFPCFVNVVLSTISRLILK